MMSRRAVTGNHQFDVAITEGTTLVRAGSAIFRKALAAEARVRVALPLEDLLGFVVRLEPKAIEQIGSELAIQWTDESETFLPLRFLRTACPCAACGGEPDVMGEVVRPNVTYTDRSFELRGWSLVGGYALQPEWGDGHNTGLYTYQYLRRIDPARVA